MAGVTRIIAGRAGGITLEVPDRGTRPTSDRVRESLFGALESADALLGARVVDLYAGSGALGLEAVSRGAASADLVEKSPQAAAILQRNAGRLQKALARHAPIRVHRVAVATYLTRAPGAFDLAFLDPPYDLSDTDLTAALTALRPLLSEHAIVVVERGRRSAAPAWAAAGLEPVRDRAYGDTTLWWGQPLPESQSR